MRRALLIVLSLWFSGLLAQTELPTPNAFVKRVEGDLKSLPEKSKWVSTEFAAVFTSSSIPQSIQDTVITTVQRLEEKNIKSTTGIYGYLRGVHSHLVSDSLRMDLWNGWHQTIESMNEDRRLYKKLNAYLELSGELFASQIIANSRASKWQFVGGEMSVGVDSVPFVDLSNGVLVCYSKGDSATIRSASGRFVPTTGKWYGSKGKVHWEGTIYNDTTQFAVLPNYEIKLSGSTFKSSPVQFHTELFDQILTGSLTFKVQKAKGPEFKTYPRFESDSEKLYLDDFFPGMDFEGGIVVKGSRLDGTGVDDEKGLLKIYNADTLFIQCALDEIMFRGDGFGSTNSEMSIYI